MVVSGKSDSSETGSRKRGRTDNAIMEPLAKKQKRLDETEKTAFCPSDNSRTTRGKKRELFTDEDALEPQPDFQRKVASRKRRKGVHETDGVIESSLEPTVWQQVTSRPTTRWQFKRMFSGTAVLGSRADRLKTLRTRVVKTQGGEMLGETLGKAS